MQQSLLATHSANLGSVEGVSEGAFLLVNRFFARSSTARASQRALTRLRSALD